jgi:cobalt-zinc-cadmium efflux system outer membrane protein
MGVITLRDAVAAALVGNPDLAAFSWEVRVREARTLQAGLLPNPELRADVENVGGSGDRQEFEDTETTLRLSQLVELGGKRAKRRRVAELGRELATWDYEAKRLSVLSGTSKAFVATLTAQERLALADESEGLAGAVERAVGATVRAGASPPVELNRAAVALGQAQVERRRADRELAAARSALAATWGGRRPAFDRVSGALARVEAVPSLEDLLARLTHNPDLARWDTEIEERTAAVALAEAGRVPDVTVGAGGRHFSDNGDNALVVELTVPLPILNWNQGTIAEARHRLSKARAEREATDVALRAAMAAAYERLASAHERAMALRERLLPQARASLDGTTDAFKKGLFRFTEVLDTQRTLFQLRGEELSALEAYHLAAAEIDRLVGSAVEPKDEGGHE